MYGRSRVRSNHDTHATLLRKQIAYVIAAYKISDHWIGEIVATIRAVYRLPAECVGEMGLVWAERRNNTHYP